MKQCRNCRDTKPLHGARDSIMILKQGQAYLEKWGALDG